MIFKKLADILGLKHNFIKYILLILTLFSVVILFIFNRMNSKAVIGKVSSGNGEWLVLSVTNVDIDKKSEIWLIDTETQMKQKLVGNREPMISGKVNTSGDILIYSDAIGTGPWDIFRLNIPAKETYQITNDLLGQFNLEFGDEKGNIIFAKSGDKYSPVPKISRIDVNKKEGKTIELGSPDLGVQDFDVRDNKISALTFSYEET